MVVLESETAAAARGARARARLLGEGNACDAYHLSRPHPEATGLRRALHEAMQRAGAAPRDIAFVNAHGTGTIENDRSEALALRALLPGVPFLSTKGYTGHALGAAGGIEACLVVDGLQRGRIPASAGFEEADPDLGVEPVREESTIVGNCAISTSVAYGGNNVALVFARGRDE